VSRTVVIVDDHASFRAVARRLLELEGFDVVGEAPDGETGVALARRLEPDLVLLDVNLPDMDGFEVAARLAREGSDAAIVLTSSRDRADFGPLVDGSPARGFVPKAELSGDALLALIA
jgi:DNA-binding NarL/FixJ family response regulator